MDDDARAAREPRHRDRELLLPDEPRVLAQPGGAGRGARARSSCPAGAGCGRGPRTTTSRRRPTCAPDPFVPYTVCRGRAGRRADGRARSARPGADPATLAVGIEVELVLGPLYEDDEHEYVVWQWTAGERHDAMSASDREIAVLGVGMHPWGKWGSNFVEYGVVAARAALADAGVDVARRPVRLRRRHDAQRLPRLRRRARRSRRRSAGRARRSSSSYAACASGRDRAGTPRGPRSSRGSCDVALVVGADTTPKGFLAPNAGERGDDPDWLRFRLLGATNPTYFGLYARRRMELFGATPRRLRRGQGEERAARAREPERAVPQGGHARRRRRVAGRLRPAAACSTSARRPTAPPRWSCRSIEYARVARRRPIPVRIARRSPRSRRATRTR